MQLILYSKPGCHLCEGLQEKLAQVRNPQFELEIRDITSRPDWFQAYQYEIPVLCWVSEGGVSPAEKALPRISPRASAAQVARLLQKYIGESVGE
ncbi:MAG: glutaredoxin family protein [Cyanobacteria bacterium P01_A01_bin.123]